jgi:hypothetical protein
MESLIEQQGVLKMLGEFEKSQSSTTKYWISYPNLVSVLLQIIRAEQTGDWHLHVHSFTTMLPWFAIYDHHNYSRWGVVYLADVKLPQETHPGV